VTCTGSGNQTALRKICSICTGSGVVIEKTLGFSFKRKCSSCNGEGTYTSDKCVECNGDKVTYTFSTLEVKLNKGIDIDHRYYFPSMGDEYPGRDTGDVYVEMVIEKHKQFRRSNSDLIHHCKISLLEALTGCSIVVKHLNGKLIRLEYNGIVSLDSNKKVVYGLGLPILGNYFAYGRMIVIFDILFPDSIDFEQIKILQDAFKEKKDGAHSKGDIKYQVYHLESFNDDQLINEEESINEDQFEEINLEFKINKDKDTCINQ
jgi:DnaJ-class molecular chaperone